MEATSFAQTELNIKFVSDYSLEIVRVPKLLENLL